MWLATTAMLRATQLASLVATVLMSTLAAQLPFTTDGPWQREPHSAVPGDGDTVQWSLERLPNPFATDHLVFETVHSLLQRWPNTRMRNGHNIVLGSIPTGTLLYRGAIEDKIPQGPDWVATDPEFSYLFCRDVFNRVQTGCWHLNLATTRPLKIIYFDGSSAAMFPGGPLDAQDLIIWGRSDDGAVQHDFERIRGLCNWGKNFGVDGFVRMQVDFEVMLCDFASGVRTVSFTNLVSQWASPPLRSRHFSFEVMNAGSWHNHFPGETRVQLDLAGLVSFYDTQLAPSLVAIRAGQERWDHRARNVSIEDLAAVKSRLEEILTRTETLSSGVDWRTLVQVIVDRYAQRLELMHYLLNSSASGADEILDLANKTQTQLRAMLTPYILFAAAPPNQSEETGPDWAIPIYKLCATTHTYCMESEPNFMTDAEKLLLQAVRGTTREICRVATKMWVAGVYAGVDPLLNTKEYPDITELTQLRTTWAEDLDRLMGWLDWSIWVKCNPKCALGELCSLPTWPFSFTPNQKRDGANRKLHFPMDLDNSDTLSSLDFRAMVMESFAQEMWNATGPESDEWIRPQPKCIRDVGSSDV